MSIYLSIHCHHQKLIREILHESKEQGHKHSKSKTNKQTMKQNLFTEKQASNKTDNSHTEKEPAVALFSTEGTFISASAVP